MKPVSIVNTGHYVNVARAVALDLQQRGGSGSSGGGLGHGGGREHMFHLSKLARANTARREFAAN
jgi:hypothetical protein